MKNLSLTQRISVYLFIVVCVSTFILNSAFFVILSTQNEEQFKTQSEEIVSNVSRYYQIPLWNLDYNAISEVTNTWLQTRSGVAAIKVTDENGGLIIEKTKDNKKLETLIKLPYTLLKKEKIFHDEQQHIGYIEILFSNAERVEQNNLTYIKSILFSLVFAFIISLISNHFLTLFVHRPLKNLIEGTLSAHSSNYTIRVPENAAGEIGILAAEFNKTMNQIEDRDRRLHKYTYELEEVIRERTLELDKQRATMINSSRLAALGEFSAGMSHEINNPLSVIIGKSSILRGFVAKGKIGSEFDIHFIKIHEMCDRISKIIKNLRSYARDGSNDPFDFFDVTRFFTDIGELTRMKLDKRGVAFKFVNNSKITRLYGKEIPLSQVIINLINNSADAAENSEDESKWVELKIEEDGQNVIISVTDSGKGIPEEIQKKMLVPFFTTKPIGKGTGLGLSISATIIEEHGGKLFYNKDCLNTQFVIRLPVKI